MFPPENFHSDSPTSKSTNTAVVSNYVYHLQNTMAHGQISMCILIILTETIFWQCFSIKCPNVATFTLYMYVPQLSDNHTSNLRLSRQINCSNTNYSDQI